MKKITRAIIYEIIPLFLMSNFFFVFVLLIEQMVQLADLVFVKSVPFFMVAQTVVFYLPSFLVMTIPVSALLSVLLAFSRFSSDSEYIVMQACGASRFTFIKPVAIFGLLSAVLSVYLAVDLVPKGGVLANNNINRIMENISINDIKEKEMYSNLGDFIFYADKKVDNSNFGNIIVIDTANNAIVSARRGALASGSGMSIIMNFSDGQFLMTEQQDRYTTLGFDNMSLHLGLDMAVESLTAGTRTMSTDELRSKFEESPVYKFEYIKRYSMGASTVVMALLGLSLGVFLHRGGKSVGIVISCGIALVFNVLFILGESFATSGKYNPVVLAWLPVIIFAVISVPMLKRAL